MKNMNILLSVKIGYYAIVRAVITDTKFSLDISAGLDLSNLKTFTLLIIKVSL